VKGQAGWWVLKLDSPDDAVAWGKSIDDGFANSSYETKTETESRVPGRLRQTAREHSGADYDDWQRGVLYLALVTGNTMAILFASAPVSWRF